MIFMNEILSLYNYALGFSFKQAEDTTNKLEDHETRFYTHMQRYRYDLLSDII